MHCLLYLNEEIFVGLIIERLQVLSVIFKCCILYIILDGISQLQLVRDCIYCNSTTNNHSYPVYYM